MQFNNNYTSFGCSFRNDAEVENAEATGEVRKQTNNINIIK
jgi:hypothetical protein